MSSEAANVAKNLKVFGCACPPRVAKQLLARADATLIGAEPSRWPRFATGAGSAFLGSTPVGFIVLLGDASADWDTMRRALRAAVGTIHRAWAG
jgi:hypothetical protein